MDALFAGLLGVLGGAAIVAVTATLWRRVFLVAPKQPKTVAELEGAVDELAITVERLAKAARRERMAGVRSAAEVPAPAGGATGTLPGMEGRKELIRARVRRLNGG